MNLLKKIIYRIKLIINKVKNLCIYIYKLPINIKNKISEKLHEFFTFKMPTRKSPYRRKTHKKFRKKYEKFFKGW